MNKQNNPNWQRNAIIWSAIEALSVVIAIILVVAMIIEIARNF